MARDCGSIPAHCKPWYLEGNSPPVGTDGDDRLVGSCGDDKLAGGAGQDVLIGNAGNDELRGDDGDDRLFGGSGNDHLLGGNGNDKLSGWDGNDVMDGGDGDDLLHGGRGDDELFGGNGNDRLRGGDGDDLLDGGEGDDHLIGGWGDDELQGGNGNDRLIGGHGDDQLRGDAGDDYLHGGCGEDDLSGGAGNDRMSGGYGNDRLDGGAGDDRLFGSLGDDEIHGGAGNDRLLGGCGDDVFLQGAGDGNDYVNGGWGFDTLRLDSDDFVLNLSRGEVVESQDGQMQLSCGAAGTITFADGSTVRFARIEQIETVASEPSDTEPPANQAPGNLDMAASGPVLEGAADGTVVGNVSATDPDAGDRLTYSLTDDADGRFVIDRDTGVVTVADGARLDFESDTQHSIGVMVTDAGGLSATRNFNIQVANVNEAPSVLGLSNAAVAEGVADGTVVGSVAASDPDAGDTLTYSLTDDADGRFAIDAGTGEITVVNGARLDFETQAEHSIGVRVTDAGGLSATQTFDIEVTDVNEAPSLLGLSNASVIEDAANGTVVGSVAASDPDAGDSLTYSLTDDADGRFAIDPDTGVITVADGTRLDLATDPDHSIEIQVSDADGLVDQATFVIEVGFDNSGNDVLVGDENPNVIDGGLGNDQISGRDGNDHLIGGAGNDELIGEDGDDRLDGDDGNDFLFGNDGDDELNGGAGNDQMFGGRDDDVLNGGDGNDRLQGSSGDDVLNGGDGDDQLFGSMGVDRLVGGAGNDRLDGGSQDDRFVFTSIDHGLDQIVSFQAGDVLAIGDMLTGFAAGSEADFVNLVDDGANTTVQVDADGAANGAVFTSIVVLNGVTGTDLDDLVNANQIDFWLS